MEKLYILGCGSALPAGKRNPSAQILETNNKLFLIDCGEGTQSRIREMNLSFEKISHIFITHMHGDHYLGLPGLLSSMSLLGRNRKLELFGPPELWDLLKLNFAVSYTTLDFEIIFHPITSEGVVWEDDFITIRSIALNHRISCFGFVFQELPKPRRINGLAAKAHNVPHYEMSALRSGKDFINEKNELIPNALLTLDPHKSISYAYCSDNRITENFHHKIEGVNWLYHEATFLHAMADRAKKTAHSTCKQAAQLALDAKVDHLLLGHYSARYQDLSGFIEEFTPIFPEAILCEEKMVFDLKK